MPPSSSLLQLYAKLTTLWRDVATRVWMMCAHFSGYKRIPLSVFVRLPF